MCGLVATVEDGKVTKLRPDKEHPITHGFACPKGIAVVDVQNDPDRPVHPLRRRPDGGVERVSWDAAVRAGSVEARVKVTDEVVRGSVCLPHGWGQRVWVDGAANGVGGPNYNTLTRAGAHTSSPSPACPSSTASASASRP